MSTHLRPGGSLGVGWGETVSRVIASTNFGAVGPVHMVTLTGGVDGYLQTILSSKGEGSTEAEATTATIIPTPIVASTPKLAAALKAEPAIQQVLTQACGVDQAIVGVGTPAADATIVQMGYLAADDVRQLRDRGVVGDILGQFFDADGQVVSLPIHDRRIGIELSELASIPKVVGVAGGLHKAEAILGALRGGFLDVLVTNELVALRLLVAPRGGSGPAGPSAARTGNSRSGPCQGWPAGRYFFHASICAPVERMLLRLRGGGPWWPFPA
jgi:lsr operon transcriptional repressor